MGPGPENEADMVTEGTYVGSRIAGNPEQDESSLHIKDFERMNRPDPQVPRHRTLSRGPLVDLPHEFLHHFIDSSTGDIGMEAHEADILFLMAEQEWCKSHRPAGHHQEDTGDLGVQSSAVADMGP